MRCSAAEFLLSQMVSQSSVGASRHVLECVSEDEVGPLTAAARAHGLEAWLAACAPATDQAWSALAEQRTRFLAARMRANAVLQDVRRLLEYVDCPWVVLKGPSLEYGAYPRPDLRHSVDLDVLVPPQQFGLVLETLEHDAGFRLVDRNWPVIAEEFPGQLRLRSPRGILVDLHWSVFNDQRVRRRFRLSTNRMLESAEWLDPPGIPVLDQASQLIHLGIHAAVSGANRLLWLLDCCLVARKIEDWNAVVAEAERVGAGRLLALVLARSKCIWDVSTPEWVLQRLAGGRSLLAADRAIGSWTLGGRDPDSPGLARAWARSTRSTQTETLLEFTRHVMGRLVGLVGRRAEHSHVLDVDDPRSALYPVVDEDSRRRYVQAVSHVEP